MTRGELYQALAAESPVWAIEPDRLEGLVSALLASGKPLAVGQRSTGVATPSTTAVVAIIGPLARRGGFLSEVFGFGSYSAISAQLANAVSDRFVDRIVLMIDSPGGAALGVEELGDEIAKANRIKPVIAIADTLAASAAYWLGSQAGEFVGTPSAEVGSIGCFALHTEMSRMLDKAGITPTFIVSKISPRKTDGNSFEPLSNEARETMQGQVDELGGRFIKAVARGRKVPAAVVPRDFGQGRTLFAPAALRAGMIDRIATLQETITARGNAGLASRRSASMTPQLPSTPGGHSPSDARRRALRLEELR